jgi:hypothetical protein
MHNKMLMKATVRSLVKKQAAVVAMYEMFFGNS